MQVMESNCVVSKPEDLEEVHVLAVDDSLIDRKVIERLLKVLSYKVTVVDSGHRALQFLGLYEQRVPSESDGFIETLKVDLIITDYCMPRMTGYELLKKIKESSTFKEIPVVIMSSENILPRIDRCLEDGAKDFIVKPVKLADVKRLKDYMTIKKVKGCGGCNGGEGNVCDGSGNGMNKRKLCPETSDVLSSKPSISSMIPSSPLPTSPSSLCLSFSPSTLIDSPIRRLKLMGTD